MEKVASHLFLEVRLRLAPFSPRSPAALTCCFDSRSDIPPWFFLSDRLGCYEGWRFDPIIALSDLTVHGERIILQN